jgi:ABC-2 type transport system permease protein
VIRVELVQLVRRPRTWVSIALLCALPVIVAVLLSTTEIGPRPGEGPALLSAVLSNGALFPAASLGMVLPLFLPVAVSVVAGDSVAGEAATGTLRYLLARPVGRTRLLVAKLASTLAFVVMAVLAVGLTGYVLGRTLFPSGGGGSVAVPVSSLSGSTLSPREVAMRTLLALAYIVWSMLGVAAVALFLSTFTQSGLAAALGSLFVLVLSEVLVGLDAASALKPYLVTRYWLAWVDLFRDPILWHDVRHGVLLQGGYVVVLLGAAWANFMTRDITA